MAIVWGAAQADSTNAFRIGYELTMSPSTVSSGTSSVTLSVKLYLGTKYYANDSGVDWSIGAGFSPGSGSKSFDHNSGTAWSSSNVTLLATVSRSVNTSYSANVTGSVLAWVTGLSAIAGSASVSVSWNIPKRPTGTPAAPTGCSHSRTSDTQHTVTWSNTSPTNAAAPYQNVQVERQTNDGSWARIATVGVVTSYTDKGTVANRKYRYRVRATNSAGASGYSTDSSFYTTPSAPSSVAAKKTTTGDIAVTWPDPTPYNTGIQVWHASDGVWESTPLATLSDVTSWTHASPSTSVTHTYKVKSTTSTPSLASAFSPQSNTVQLLAPPLAPTNLSPSSSAVDAVNPVVLSWQHNTADTTDQTAFEVQHRTSGGAWATTGKVTSGVQSWTLPASTYSNGSTLEWQVRTWGDHVDPSPWSALATVPLSSAPTVLINTPVDGDSWLTSRVSVTWGYNDEEFNPQARWQAVLYNAAGDVMERIDGSGDGNTVEFGTAVADGFTYSVGVIAADSTGIWSAEDVVTFPVAFAKPPRPELTLEWIADAAAVAVSVHNPPTEIGEADAVSVSLWRSVNGADWVLIADSMDLDSSATDFIPGLGVVNYYKATAVSDLPSVSESIVEEIVTDQARAVWVNAGPGFSQAVRLASAVKVDKTSSRAKSLRRVAGREFPLEVSGQQRTRSINLSARLWAPTHPRAALSSSWDELEEVADMIAPACFRSPEGDRVFVSTGDLSETDALDMTRGLSWSFERVDYAEPTGEAFA